MLIKTILWGVLWLIILNALLSAIGKAINLPPIITILLWLAFVFIIIFNQYKYYQHWKHNKKKIK